MSGARDGIDGGEAMTADSASEGVEACARIVARCMEWSEHVRVRRGGMCRTDEVVRFVEELRGIAGQVVERAAGSGRDGFCDGPRPIAAGQGGVRGWT